MLRKNLFFDTLNALLINVPMHIFIQSHMHNLIKSSSRKIFTINGINRVK